VLDERHEYVLKAWKRIAFKTSPMVVYTVYYMAVWYDFVLEATVVHLIGQ